jgi:alpha-1,6-mannosyltransferase
MPERQLGSLLPRRRVRLAVPLGAALAVTVAAMSAATIGGSRFVGASGLLLVVLATAAWAFVVSDARVEQRPGLVALAVGVAIAIGLTVPPRDSHDLWSYVMYGRMVAAHHVSPYTHTPSDFRLDPFFGQVGVGWRHATSVYGPLFSGMSAGLVRAAGTSALRARLAFQGLAAISLVGALALIWKSTRSARAVAFVGLHPAMIMAIVNGGHNDALVGLAILAGALLASRQRWFGAGFAVGLGILVKASGAFGLIGLAAWSIGRDRRGALQLAGAAGITTALGYAPFGTTAVRAAAHAGNGNSRVSIWDPVSSLLHPSTATMTAVVLLLTIVAAWRWRAASRPDTTAVAATAAFLVGGVYVLPWYSAWALPTAARQPRSRLSALVAAHAALVVAVYEFELPAHPILNGFGGVVRTVIVQVGVWSALAAFVVLLFVQRARARRAPATPTPIPTAAPPSPRSCC